MLIWHIIPLESINTIIKRLVGKNKETILLTATCGVYNENAVKLIFMLTRVCSTNQKHNKFNV